MTTNGDKRSSRLVASKQEIRLWFRTALNASETRYRKMSKIFRQVHLASNQSSTLSKALPHRARVYIPVRRSALIAYQMQYVSEFVAKLEAVKRLRRRRPEDERRL